MEYYKYIVVILVYRNTSDLVECIDSIRDKVPSYKIIVVNAYYDDATRNEVERITNQYDCEFINIDNKGYSYGNNRGIELAIKKYNYDYIIISNPDIVIERFDDTLLNEEFGYDIIAPKITASLGRAQNPMAICENRLIAKIVYLGFKRRAIALVYLGIAITKIIRFCQLLIYKILKCRIYRIHQAHGSFVLISKKAIEALNPVYDEKMFLFAEETVLAAKAKRNNVKICYYEPIAIRHKEDGSMKLSNMMLNEVLRDSNLYCYEHYIKENNNCCE